MIYQRQTHTLEGFVPLLPVMWTEGGAGGWERRRCAHRNMSVSSMRWRLVLVLVLNTLLVLSVKLEDNTAYRACLAIPANCGQLYAARSSSPGHACASRGNRGACDALVTAERVWGVMQAPVQPRRGALGHHSHGGGVVHGSLGPVRTATALHALLTHGGC